MAASRASPAAGAEPGSSGIGRRAGVGVSAGGAVGCGATTPPWGTAKVPAWGTICGWNVGGGVGGTAAPGATVEGVSDGAAMLVCPGMSWLGMSAPALPQACGVVCRGAANGLVAAPAGPGTTVADGTVPGTGCGMNGCVPIG